MSMTAGDIMVKVRLYLNDTAKTRYEDWQIYQGINDAMRVLAEENARSNGTWLREQATLVLNNGSAALPDNFLKEIKAFDMSGAELLNVHTSKPSALEFSVRGDSLCSESLQTTLWYYSYPAKVSTRADALELPSSMLLPIAQTAAQCVANAYVGAVNLSKYFTGQNIQQPQAARNGE